MTEAQAYVIFSEIIWSAELSNLSISEYLSAYEDEMKIWIETEDACTKAGIPVFKVATK